MNGEIQNGASIIRAGDFADPTAIPATINLPAAVWERLTADLRDDDRMSLGRPELPDTPLYVRIAMFLEMQVIAWECPVLASQASGGPVSLEGDLDDGVLF